jgi:hypothetical protein
VTLLIPQPIVSPRVSVIMYHLVPTPESFEIIIIFVHFLSKYTSL